MKNFFFLVLFIALGWGGYYVYENRHDVFSSTKGVRNLSISSDGRYVVSAHYGKKLVLWDIEKRTKTVLADRVNTNSPYFIPNSHDFMWQDKNNVVHIQNVEGQEITHFKHYKVERHLMSEDRTLYISADQTGEIYKGYGDDIVPIYTDTPIRNHYNFSLSKKYFLSASPGGPYDPDSAVKLNPKADPVQPSDYKKSSYNGVTLWDRETLKPVARLGGFGGRSDALFSPDGKWIVGGGENLRHYMWETAHLTNRLRLADPDRGIRNPKGNDDSLLLRVPGVNMGLNNPVTYAFVTETEFIEFRMSAKKDGLGEKYSPLYTVGDPWIKAFVEIGNNPVISTDFYEKSNSVASAPKAHILVTGQAYHGGINVYRYHPDKMELEKIWVAY
ncbi:WD40 repeat domain-containing protein [Rodentibacter pneumotropicus]|uniref:WD40 repeat domain-containing protein n=1 Tax=Rodentibacter pneumotropicus TaxID=758 RepID=UPI00232F3669|nr:WD40 repeat domain-containing protein [Rodentibacter pneumotropicus]MDC2826500.1 WD40 repeat domain-containing protein [Rodentibacter pneumotropicus]